LEVAEKLVVDPVSVPIRVLLGAAQGAVSLQLMKLAWLVLGRAKADLNLGLSLVMV
jgi:hypothetical protein